MNKKGMDGIWITYIIFVIVVLVTGAIIITGINKDNQKTDKMYEIITIDLVCEDSQLAYTLCNKEVDLNPGCQKYIYDLKKTCNNFKVEIAEDK